MIRIMDRLAGDNIQFHYVEEKSELEEVRDFIWDRSAIAIDTESTRLNCYHPDWRLKTVQYGDATDSYVVPAQFKNFVYWSMGEPINWIGHNGPHDIRCIDAHLRLETGVVCAGETYIPSHHIDSRGKDEGGTGHKLEELAKIYVDPQAGKWDKARKEAFKEITIPIEGEVFKSGPRKGQPKTRKAKLSEGWSLIDSKHPAMIAYAAADPILTYRVWQKLQPVVKEFHKLYRFDKQVALACDKLQRRAMLVDVDYTQRLSNAYAKRAHQLRNAALEYGCENIQSGDQIAKTLLMLGIKLTVKTDSGKWKTDAELLRRIAEKQIDNQDALDFIKSVLGAKQVEKRRESYTQHILEELDENSRIHPSINSLAARTTRMSVSGPPLQQLPTQDHEEDLTYE